MKKVINKLPWRVQTLLGLRPKKVFHSLLNYFKEYSSPQIEEEFLTVVYPGYVKDLKLPYFTNPRSLNHENYLNNKTLSLNNVQFGAIKNARVYQNNFHPEIITSKNILLNTFTNDLKRKIKKHTLLNVKDVGAPLHLKGKSIVLAATGAHNGYYHWILDSLTKIHVLNKFDFSLNDFDHIIVSGPSSKYKIETLKVLNVPLEKFHFIEEGNHIKTDYLVFIDTIRYHTQGTNFLKEYFKVDQLKTSNKLIFISREQAGFRNIIDQERLFDFLKDFGFEKVILENLTVHEQAKIMAEAKFVISPHGAGLANIVFCNPETVLFEIVPDEYANINYWFHSNFLDINYYSYISKSQLNNGQTRPNTKDIVFEEDLFQQLTSTFEKYNISK